MALKNETKKVGELTKSDISAQYTIIPLNSLQEVDYWLKYRLCLPYYATGSSTALNNITILYEFIL